ncbi:hypothetical protein DPMN_111745 [Dreissena polymorpha]|uniref:Uncharacterized protein n=1 Tax=Dreissena polymorpha TaxID=45954 RepID=A0A9D4QQ26_DREPO|nr:hypothetical protein DPMN_111745 [Dreissena polymorpha]
MEKDMGNVRTKVKTVGKLLKKLHIQGKHPLLLEHFIIGSKFIHVVNATIAISKQEHRLAGADRSSIFFLKVKGLSFSITKEGGVE